MVVMVTDLHLHMGWTGDSHIILVRRGDPAFASQPHKPEREVMSYREGQIYASTNVIRVSITYSQCPEDIIYHLIGEVRKNVLTPASLDTCTLTDAPSLRGESDNTASARPAASSVASTGVYI